MERRMLMAVVLSFLAVTAWSASTGGCQPPQEKPKEEQAVDAGTDDGAEPATDGASTDGAGATDGGMSPGTDDAGDPKPPGPEPVDPENGGKPKPPAGNSPLAEHPHANTPASSAELQSDELAVGFTSLGGGIEYIRMRNVFEEDGKTPMNLVVPSNPHMLMAQMDNELLKPTAAPGGDQRKNEPAGPMRTLNWIHNKALQLSTPEDDVIFEMTHQGVTVRRIYTLEMGKERYGVRLNLLAWQAGSDTQVFRVGMLASSGQLREVFMGAFGNPNNVMVFRTGEGEVDNDGTFGYAPTELAQEGVDPPKLRLLGTRSTYFMATYYADIANGISAPISRFWATGEQGDLRPSMESTLTEWFQEHDVALDNDIKGRIKDGVAETLHAWMVVDMPVAASEREAKPLRLDFYAGPIDRQILGQDGYEPLDPVITYPSAPDAVAKVLLWIYDLWRSLTGSAGLAIIMMTLCVRGGLMPLSIRNQLSMRSYGRKVAKLKPKVAALQEKFSKNPKRLREEQMKLYREHGVGFPSGCVMMLIQIPIFFSLFSALRVEYTIRGQSFLWIKDLAGPDRLIDFHKTLFDLGIFRLDAINLLPILMVVLSIWHTRSMPKPADEQQAQQMKMMKWMPIFFAFILYNYTAALALYMVFSSAIALIEAKIVRAKDDSASNADEAAAPA